MDGKELLSRLTSFWHCQGTGSEVVSSRQESERDIADILLIGTKTVGNIVFVIMRLEMSKTY